MNGHGRDRARRWSLRSLLRRQHRHDWRVLGYGGAGWHAYRCAGCDRTDIG